MRGSGTAGKIAVISECTCEHAAWQQRHAGAARGWHPPLPPGDPLPGLSPTPSSPHPAPATGYATPSRVIFLETYSVTRFFF